MEWLTEQIFVLDDFLDDSECEGWIERAEDAGFDVGAVFTPEGERIVVHLRDCAEVVFEDEDAAQALAQALRACLDDVVLSQFVGVHPRLRVMKYEEGQHFSPHTDVSTLADDGASRTQYTLLIYLNSPAGGQTYFPDRWGESMDVEPIIGRALGFEHDVLHGGAEVIHGVKYLLRADVLCDLTVA